jgi:hypothetical protein
MNFSSLLAGVSGPNWHELIIERDKQLRAEIERAQEHYVERERERRRRQEEDEKAEARVEAKRKAYQKRGWPA